MLTITCPSCSRKLQVPDNAGGKQVRCPLCNHVFQAEAPPPVLPVVSPPAAPAPAAPAPPPQPIVPPADPYMELPASAPASAPPEPRRAEPPRESRRDSFDDYDEPEPALRYGGAVRSACNGAAALNYVAASINFLVMIIGLFLLS